MNYILIQMGAILTTPEMDAIVKRLLCKLLTIALIVTSTSVGWSNDGKQKQLDWSDLGISKQANQANPELQKLLDERRFYLRQHQIWGMVTSGAMILTMLSGQNGELPIEHPLLAGIAMASYSAAAFTSFSAPDPKSENSSGPTWWHKQLRWIHMPGMLASMVLGYQASQKMKKGEKLDGPEKYHQDIATITTAALVASSILVSFEF